MAQSAIEDLVEKYGGIDSLSPEEKATYFDHLKIVQGKALEVDDVKDFVRKLITQIEQNLAVAPEGTLESIGLKSRLKDMLTMEAFLFTPERAKAAIERYYRNHKDQQI